MRSSPIRVGPNCNDKPFIREGTQGGGWGRRGQGPGGVGLCFSEWQVSPGASRPMRLAWDGFSLSLRRVPVCRCSSQTSASGGPRGNDLVQSQDVNTPAPQPRNPLPAPLWVGLPVGCLEHLGVVSAWRAEGAHGLLAMRRPGQARSLAPGHD